MPGFNILPPWDANRYFATPIEITVTPGGSFVKALSANPQRVYILFSPNSPGNAFQISTVPGSANTLGFSINSNSPPFELHHDVHGPLCQAEWWVKASLGVVITILQLVLNDWPYDLTESR